MTKTTHAPPMEWLFVDERELLLVYHDTMVELDHRVRTRQFDRGTLELLIEYHLMNTWVVYTILPKTKQPLRS